MEKDKLYILWTTDNKLTSLNMVLMYSLKASKEKFWKEIRLVSWGASNVLINEDREVQERLKEVQESGVIVKACIRCAENLGITDSLEKLGIELDFMGQPLTDCLKDDSWAIITI
ncbi:DsrE family protein [Anaerovorax odorimutans]|uniref:DsrE family protein n=1 Tax=Anaerovorax odorimutans TaxID=109327 RepID=UPI0003FFA55D|nr:DsrE family protein [Anaerovorax odorimutans]